MNKLLQILVLVSSIFLLSGCDMFRKMAGRPTSAEIQAKRELIEKEQKSHAQRLDSIDIIQKQISDSLETLDSIRNSKNTIVSSRQLAEDSKINLEYRYYIIVGAFGKQVNAEALASKARAEGYKADLISFVNGFTAVGVCPSNSLSAAYASLSQLQDKSFCPKDAWILDKR